MICLELWYIKGMTINGAVIVESTFDQLLFCAHAMFLIYYTNFYFALIEKYIYYKM